MATIFRARRNLPSGSGGKIVRGRRVAAVASPYARPPSPNPSTPPPESPNWLLGLVVPATRMIVNGAGKIVSSVFGSQDSSDSSDEDSDSSSENDENDEVDDASEEADRLNENVITSDTNKYVERESQAIVQRSNTKLEIERLLMQETFSRDECNRLTKIIQSRVVEGHTSRDDGNGGGNEYLGRTITSSMAVPGAFQPRLSSPYLDNGPDSLSPKSFSYRTAIMEAKKWLEEKKSESCSRLDSVNRNFTSSPFVPPDVNEGEMGSPVIMAKTYMRARPPWSSPSSSHVGFRTPSPIGMHLVKEEAPYTVGPHFLSSSQYPKRNSFADASWNILADSRRVRLKSEESSLPPNTSSHIESTPELEHDEKQDGELGVTHESNSLPAERSVNSSADLPAKVTTDGALVVQENLGNETMLSTPDTVVSNLQQNLKAARVTEVEGCSNFVTNELLAPNCSSLHEDASLSGPLNQSAEVFKPETDAAPLHAVDSAVQSEVDLTRVDDSREVMMHQDSQLGETVLVEKSSQLIQFSEPNEAVPLDVSRPPGVNHVLQKEVASNGYTSPASSLPTGLNKEPVTGPAEERSCDSKMGTSITPLEEENCELLSEASVEIPINDEKEDSESNSSSGKQSKDMDYLPSSRVWKQEKQGKRARRYIKRGARGKGKMKQNNPNT